MPTLCRSTGSRCSSQTCRGLREACADGAYRQIQADTPSIAGLCWVAACMSLSLTWTWGIDDWRSTTLLYPSTPYPLPKQTTFSWVHELLLACSESCNSYKIACWGVSPVLVLLVCTLCLKWMDGCCTSAEKGWREERRSTCIFNFILQVSAFQKILDLIFNHIRVFMKELPFFSAIQKV